MSITLIVATTNRGKLKEFRELLAGLPLNVISVDEALGAPVSVVEDGVTFADNAIKKAVAIAAASGFLTLADDSGLEVDALGGRPGVYSARFAHEHATDGENNAALVAALTASPPDTGRVTSGLYRARFRCSLAIVDGSSDDRRPYVVDGTCEGSVGLQLHGHAGFGYDPLFFPEGAERTLAQYSAEEKHAISHRARAFRALRPRLEEIIVQKDRSAPRNRY